MSHPRVLLCVSSLGASGAVHYVDRILPMLLDAWGYAALATLPGSWIHRRWEGKVPLFLSGFERFPLHTVDACARFCALEKIDLVHSHMSRANNFAALLQEIHSIPNVSHAHENKPHPRYWLPKLVIAVSRDTLARHRKLGVGVINRSALLYNFVDDRVFRPKTSPAHNPAERDPLRELMGVPADAPVLVHVGEICRRKGQDITLEAMSAIWQQHPQAQVAFVGHGTPLRHASSQDSRVHWLGQREDLPELLPHATLAVMPAREEPFGLAIVEAMACAVPVVASATGGPREIITQDSGCLVPTENPQALAQEVCKLLINPALHTAIAKAGHQRASLFSRKTHQTELIALLQSALL